MTAPRRLILASGSPRRRDLLQAAGFAFDVRTPDVDESPRAGELPEALVERLARDKAAAVASVVPADAEVLAADTLVVLGEAIIGKPRDEAEACAMLLRLSDQTHRVLTGFALRSGDGRDPHSAVEQSWVRFHAIDPHEAAAYVATGEPMDKAGAYAAQGQGARFIAEIRGLRSNVIGLPVETLLPLLAARGIQPA